METYFNLLGLNILLKTPHDIQISDSLLPFQQPACDQSDCVIDLSYGPLPAPELIGDWHGFCFYDSDGQRIFHSELPGGAHYASVDFQEKGRIQITVNPKFANYFSGTAGIFNRVGFENLMLQHQSFLLHASLIKYAGQGIAFAGSSGVGKSTQADLWATYHQATILNGDRAALRRTETGWMAYGSPFAGTSNIYCNDQAPLRAVVVLEQGNENRLEQLNGAQAMLHLWPEISARRWDRDFTAACSALCTQLIEEIPVYLLTCLPNEDATTLLKKGLSL